MAWPEHDPSCRGILAARPGVKFSAENFARGPPPEPAGGQRRAGTAPTDTPKHRGPFWSAMRAILLAAIVLGVAFAGILIAPEASACTGDPSVCGIKKSAECTLREGASTELLDECWRWL